MTTRIPTLARCAAAALFLAACGGSTPKAEAPDPAEESEPASEPKAEAKEEEAAPKRKSIKELIAASQSFHFVLADSDAKATTTADCEKKSKGNEDKLADCIKKVEEAAALEGIRFAPGDEDGVFWWISFGEEKGKEVVYNKVAFSIADEEVDKATLVPRGKDTGKRPMKKLPPEMVVESPDENTVVMTDPTKGKLVYRVR